MPWKATYPKEIRNQMIELVQAGMSPEELSRKHERHPRPSGVGQEGEAG